MTLPIDYLTNAYFKEKINRAPFYKKSSPSLLRLPKPEEIGSILTTYVKDTSCPQGYRIESQTKIDGNYILARNEEVIAIDSEGQNIYNDYPMTKAVLMANYGFIYRFLTFEYLKFQKTSLVKCVELDSKMLQELAPGQKEILLLMPNDQTPMKAVEGDYLTSSGYSISQHHMKNYKKI